MAYAQENPKIAFDESGPYFKYYTIYNTGPYGSSIFANLLEENGFSVYRLTDYPLNYETIQQYDVLILMAPGRNYTDPEISDIKKYVNQGGGLFLVADGWGEEDGDENYAFNKIARSFGVSFEPNIVVVDEKNSIGFSNYVKVKNIKSDPITYQVPNFYFLKGTYLIDLNTSTALAYSENSSWADKGFLNTEGRSINNEKIDANETKGPLPLLSSMKYGKGKIIFYGSAGTFTNSWIYRSNGWKLSLNSINWLANKPIPSNYNGADLFSFTLVDLEYKFLGLFIFSLVVILILIYVQKLETRNKRERGIKTIKNWKYTALLGINILFAILGILLFIPLNFFLFDKSIPDIYDPYFGYVLLTTGIIFLILAILNCYNLYHRQRIPPYYSYLLLGALFIFSGITIFIGEIFAFPLMSIFTLGSVILTIPFIINLRLTRIYGNDLIIEGKEFNRLAKLTGNRLPYELHAIYNDPLFIGEGGFGRVFKAKRKEGMEVAIKIPKTFDKNSEKIFITEVSNWRQLDHPHIVKLYNYKILPIPYIEMEYCDSSLSHGKKSLDEAITIIYQVAQGLNYAHEKKIIHGDVKTSNIMIKQDMYKISDWGLSKMKFRDSITLSGATPQYAAPEQISEQFGKADERTDIYQLGTVFYELVTGELPFKGEITKLYDSIMNKNPSKPSKINPKSLLVENIIMKCLNKNKNERYSSMKELINDLEKHYNPPTRDKTQLYKD